MAVAIVYVKLSQHCKTDQKNSENFKRCTRLDNAQFTVDRIKELLFVKFWIGGGGDDASVACNLPPQHWQVYLAWSGYVPHPRKVFDPVTSMLRWCRLGSTLRGIVTGKHGSYRSHVTCGIDTASHTWQSGDQRRERRLQLIFTTKHLICSSSYSYC